MPRSPTAIVWCKSIFSCVRNQQTVFQRGCAILRSHPCGLRVPVAPHRSAAFVVVTAAGFSHRSRCAVVLPCFNVQFPNGIRWATSFHRLRCLLYLLWWGVCSDLLPFFFLIYFIYLCSAVLGFCYCAWAFSSCGERGLLFVAVHGLLIAVAALVAEHGL